MVTMQLLVDARPGRWLEAARGWRTFAYQSVEASRDIRQQGAAKVDEHWRDAVGAEAALVLERIANGYDVASDLMNAVAMVLVGLGEAVEIAQKELLGAVASAQVHRLTVNADGVTTPVDADDADAARWKTALDPVIRDAVEAATQADAIAARQFAKLAGEVDVTTVEQALKDQGEAGLAQLEMIRDSIPHGQSPEAVAAWWNSLSDGEKEALKRAVPIDLVDLAGIPDDVKKDLRGSSVLDPVEVARYALTHWNDESTDWPGKDNCTNFASNALAGGGMPQNGAWTDHELLRSLANKLPGVDVSTATHSWGGAQALHDYLLTDTQSQSVPRQDVRPGDVVFWTQRGPNDDPVPGEVHHTAVVTAVTPDGVIHYTQHSDSMVNGSLDGRSRNFEHNYGDQEYTFVRVNPEPVPTYPQKRDGQR